jgi:hypothetical protein
LGLNSEAKGGVEGGYAAAVTQQEVKIKKTEQDLNQILKKKIEGIQGELTKFNSFMTEFAASADEELVNLVGNVNLLYRSTRSPD